MKVRSPSLSQHIVQLTSDLHRQQILRSAVPCRCSVCSRMRKSGAAVAQPTAALDDNEATEANTEFVQCSSASRSSRAESSSSSERAPPLPAAAVRLPPELLDSIFAYARPAAPRGPFKRVPVSLAWGTFARLALVHSSWRYSAQRALAARVVLRSEDQIRALTRALQLDHLAGEVEEIVLDLKELPEPADEHDDHDQSLSTRQSFGPALLDLLQHCGGSNLKTLRCRGFGDTCLASLSPQLAARLAHLETFEYAPIDESAPPTLHQVGLLQSTFPRLKHLAVHPCPRALNHLLHDPPAIELMGLVPMESIAAQIEPTVAEYLSPLQQQPGDEPPGIKYMRQAMEILAAGLRAALESLEMEEPTRDLLNLNLGLYLTLFEEPPTLTTPTSQHAHAHGKLESISLQSVAISPFGLTSFLPSYKTLTSLSLSSVVLCGSSITILLTLACFAPNLISFSLHEYPRVERRLQPLNDDNNNNNNPQQQQAAAATPPPPGGGGGVGGAGRPGPGPGGIAITDPHFFLDSASSLTSSHFWLLLRSLTRVESLSLTTSHVFTASPHREEFHLPLTIKKLDLSSNSEGDVEVEREGIAWWLGRIEELHRGAGEGPQGDGAERGGASGRNGPEHAETTAEEDRFAHEGFDEDSSDDYEFDDDDDSSSSSSSSDDGSVSTFNPPEDRAPDSHPPAPTSAASLTPAPAPAPSSIDSASRPATATATATAAQINNRRPRPHLVQLSLTTRTSPRRLVKGIIGKSIVRKLDALRNNQNRDEGGTRVDWYGMQIIVIEPLDMSHELRIQMSEVPPSWSSGGDARA